MLGHEPPPLRGVVGVDGVEHPGHGELGVDDDGATVGEPDHGIRAAPVAAGGTVHVVVPALDEAGVLERLPQRELAPSAATVGIGEQLRHAVHPFPDRAKTLGEPALEPLDPLEHVPIHVRGQLGDLRLAAHHPPQHDRERHRRRRHRHDGHRQGHHQRRHRRPPARCVPTST